MNKSQMLSLKQCAEDLNISYKTVHRWVSVNNLVPHMNIMGTIRVHREDWERFKNAFWRGQSAEWGSGVQRQ